MPGGRGGHLSCQGAEGCFQPQAYRHQGGPLGGSACQPLRLVPAWASPVQPVSRCAGTWRSQVAKADWPPKAQWGLAGALTGQRGLGFPSTSKYAEHIPYIIPSLNFYSYFRSQLISTSSEKPYLSPQVS